MSRFAIQIRCRCVGGYRGQDCESGWHTVDRLDDGIEAIGRLEELTHEHASDRAADEFRVFDTGTGEPLTRN